MRALRRSLAATAAAAMLATGGMFVSTGTAWAADGNVTTVTPNPWYANGPFEGWGTSLAWLANATGNYGEEGSITRSSGDAEADAKALEYGKALREEFYQSIFGANGLDLNMARYNVGGGNASDVAYGYPFMRQGANVPGYWAEDADGSKNLYDGVTTTQQDKEALDEAFDASSDSSYVWGEGNGDDANAKAVKAQEWWLTRAAKDGDITHVEAFANSAPWFMTESGYATGGYESGNNNLKDSEKFAQYLAKVVAHLNTLQAENGNKVSVDTVEPFNESETNYWGTPSFKADASYDASNTELINRYWTRYYENDAKDKSVTPYSTAVKKPQEGMHVDSATAQKTVLALQQALQSLGLDDTVDITATDATDSGQFVESYNKYSQEVRDAIGQYNTHSYGTNNQRVARDIAQGDSKKISQSEVDGSWLPENDGFNPYGFDNGLGMAGKINSDVYALQSKDFNFWQVVEDLYNMSTGTEDINGNTANPAGENLNWGTVFIDFDCTVAGKDGRLYSERAVDNNNGSTEGIKACSVVVNSKYNAVRAYTKFIHEDDAIIANNATADNMTATSADGLTQTVIHRNSGSSDQTLVIDLSKYGDIADDAAGKLYLTTAPEAQDDAYAATLDYMNRYSNVEQDAASVVIDKEAKTATVTIPARSIASIQLTGVTGAADDAAAVTEDASYQLIGKQSGKALAAVPSDDSALSLAAQASAGADEATLSAQTWSFTKVDMSGTERPTLPVYVMRNGNGKVLVAQNGTNVLKDMSLDEAKADASARWIVNTEDGEQWQLVNAAAKQSLDVNGQSSAVGTKVGLWNSNAGANQTWTMRSTKPTGVKDVNVQTAVGEMPALPETVTPYYAWGEGSEAAVTWDDAALAEQVKTAGTYEVKGTAKDVYGNVVEVFATVVVGAFTVSDPASMTVGEGASLADVQALAPTTVDVHVGDSVAFGSAVTWDWSGLSDADFAKTGKVVVEGTAGDGADGEIKARLSVYVTEASVTDGENLAMTFCANAQASSTEGSNVVANTCDGKTDGKAWSNWKDEPSADDKDPWVSYTFDAARRLNSLDFVSFGEATPKRFDVQYLDASGAWVDSGVSAETGANVNRGDVTRADLSSLPATRGVRLKLTYRDDANYYAKISEVRIYEADQTAAAASDATLGDLRVGGVTVEGFDADKTDYTVGLPLDAEANPTLHAYASDEDATVKVTGTAVKDGALGGKATIRVTSADGSETREYTVTFDAAAYEALKVTAPAKTEYRIGDKLDTTGMKVTATYRRADGTMQEREIALDDAQLSVEGFDSAVAGEKTVRVSYRGRSAEFKVTVKADEVTPGPDEQDKPKPGEGDESSDGSSGDTPSKPAAKPGKGTLSATGADVSAAVGVVALLIAAAGVMLITRKRRG